MDDSNLASPLQCIVLVEPVPIANRLTIILLPDGRISVHGEAEQIRDFADQCQTLELDIRLDFCSPCG